MIDTHDRFVRDLANAAQAAIAVDYSRAPEAQYPVAIEEAYAATAWVKAHGRSVGLDPSPLAVAGDSAGGNMAAVLTLLAKMRGGPAIDYQVLFCPAVDAFGDMPSYAEFADGRRTRAGLGSVRTRPTGRPPRRMRCGKTAILQASANATLDQTKMFAQQVGEVYRCHGQWKGKADAAGRRAGNGGKCGSSAKMDWPS